MSKLLLRNISKSFSNQAGERIRILQDIDLEIAEGAFFTLLGPSGCGKSTLLNIVAGFEEPTSGDRQINGTPIKGPGTDRTVIFQDVSNALFPYMTVFENVDFGPKMSGKPKSVRKETVETYLKLVHLGKDADKFPFELSGGMKQRVQIARALANDPDILLMDEPFASLDAITKKHLQLEL
ncbi:MAG TPA: ATP-binding cassette domain-containing protein, partial [Bacillales bacterium]|nr:ATP-binding cassette domain-containing protein [Bacillales bacterium]